MDTMIKIMFPQIWEKYIEKIKNRIDSGFELSSTERKKLMELIANGYEQIGNKAEAVSWRAKAVAERINDVIPEATCVAEADFVECFKRESERYR